MLYTWNLHNAVHQLHLSKKEINNNKDHQKQYQLLIHLPKAPRHTSRSPGIRKEIFFKSVDISQEIQPNTNGVPKKQLVHTRNGYLELESQRRDIYTTKKEKEREMKSGNIEDWYQESTAKLNSEAQCYKMGEEYYFNRDILNPLRRKFGACWEPATIKEQQKHFHER